jgi:hypothetical protein
MSQGFNLKFKYIPCEANVGSSYLDTICQSGFIIQRAHVSYEQNKKSVPPVMTDSTRNAYMTCSTAAVHGHVDLERGCYAPKWMDADNDAA